MRLTYAINTLLMIEAFRFAKFEKPHCSGIIRHANRRYIS